MASLIKNENKAVISHGWPIDTNTALAFRAVYFSLLTDGSLAISLSLAQSILQSQIEILACLEEIDPNLQAIDRLRGDSKKSNLENIMSWGSAAVYC